MPSPTTPNLGLAKRDRLGDEQKVLSNDELIDMVVQPVVSSIANAPPGSPVEGTTVLVGTSPTGAFAGKANNIARFNGKTWRFVPGKQGWSVWNIGTGALLRKAANGTWA